MYVCLKNIFASSGLDDILLQEYAELELGQQDIYRLVAALEAAGGRVHRQLILRLLAISADSVSDLLKGLEGIVDEHSLNPAEGLYIWATRHEVIGETIARYKYSQQDQLRELLEKTIDALNPGVRIELKSLREICNSQFGIASIGDDHVQLALYGKIVDAIPGERGPRHTLIRKLLEMRKVDEAAQAIRLAEETVGSDRPIARYKVRLAILRAETTPGILREDRVAILNHAEGLALETVKKYPDDRFAYLAYTELGTAVAETSGNTHMLDDAISMMSEAADRILDPEMSQDLARLERRRQQLALTE